MSQIAWWISLIVTSSGVLISFCLINNDFHGLEGAIKVTLPLWQTVTPAEGPVKHSGSVVITGGVLIAGWLVHNDLILSSSTLKVNMAVKVN